LMFSPPTPLRDRTFGRSVRGLTTRSLKASGVALER
jgi:hypothetical protein